VGNREMKRAEAMNDISCFYYWNLGSQQSLSALMVTIQFLVTFTRGYPELSLHMLQLAFQHHTKNGLKKPNGNLLFEW